jgi:isoaspartyl peptidase/L-asparaginase-like protein (Ntn-hydrolase superfamily)
LKYIPKIIIHGGVTADSTKDYRSPLKTLEKIVSMGFDLLMNNTSAIDVAQECVRLMEDSGQFLAGRGSVPNADGTFELDASIMDGASGRGAGVAAVRNATAAVGLARRVLEETGHSLIVGEGVRAAVGADGALFTDDPENFYRPIFSSDEIKRSAYGFGTVGAAVLDANGQCAAATATCGVFKKLPGRVGDTPVLGAGTWADRIVAVSCTGQGEFFLRTNAAREVSARVRLAGDDLWRAADAAIKEVTLLGGLGGLIVANRDGIAWSFNTFGLKRAWIDETGATRSAVS